MMVQIRTTGVCKPQQVQSYHDYCGEHNLECYEKEEQQEQVQEYIHSWGMGHTEVHSGQGLLIGAYNNVSFD